DARHHDAQGASTTLLPPGQALQARLAFPPGLRSSRVIASGRFPATLFHASLADHNPDGSLLLAPDQYWTGHYAPARRLPRNNCFGHARVSRPRASSSRRPSPCASALVTRGKKAVGAWFS